MRPLLLILAGFFLHQAQPRDLPRRNSAELAGSATISGRVYATGSGAAIPGALVLVVPAQPAAEDEPRSTDLARFTTITDALGRFRIAAVTPGTYRVVASPGVFSGRYLPAGYGSTRPNDAGKPIAVSPGDELRNVDIALVAGAAIEGRVLDESGEPLTRISVFAARIMAGSDVAQRAAHAPATTDDLGRYRIYGLEPGEYVVAADAAGAGVVVNWHDSRSFSASFTERDPATFATTFYPSSLTDGAAQRIRLGAAADVMAIDIALVRTRRVELAGMVLDSQGVPARSTTGILVRPGMSTGSSASFTTDAEGRFRARAVEPGDYRLMIGGGPGLVSVNGRAEFADLPITINSDPGDLVIVTQPGVTVSGRVVFAESPPAQVPPVKVTLQRHDAHSGGGAVAATFDDQLRFVCDDVFGAHLVRVSSLPEGWVVKAVTLNGTDITDTPTVFTREHSGQLEIVLSARASAIEGQVRGDAGTRLDAIVYVFAEDRTSWSMWSPRTVSEDTDEHGRFSVGGLAAGRYYAIAIAREGFRMPPDPGETFFSLLSKEATPFVVGDEERRPIELRLWRWPE